MYFGMFCVFMSMFIINMFSINMITINIGLLIPDMLMSNLAM